MSENEPRQMKRVELRPDTSEQDERTLSTVSSPTVGIPRDIHEYAVAFAEYRVRSKYRPFSVRQRFDVMTDQQIVEHLDNMRKRIAERYGLEPL